MKKLFIVILAVFLMSCSAIKFETVQPIDGDVLKAFPKTFVGEYLSEDKKDTLTVTKSNFSIGKDKITLGDSLVLKMYNEYYSLNVKDDSGFWQVCLFKKNDKNIVANFFDLDKDNPFVIKKLKEVLPVKEIKNDKDIFYLINPTKEEFQALIDKNLFIKKEVFTKIK